MKTIIYLALSLSAIVAAGYSKDGDNLGLNSNISDRFDPLFAQELQKCGYVDNAEYITFAEVKDITELVISGFNYETHEKEGELTSLRGIEYFESLEYLKCSSNQLTALDVSKNTALVRLWCDDNQLTALDVSKNTELKELNCSWNQLTTLDVSKNAALIYVYCSDNQLTALDISNNTVLKRLYCFKNPGNGTTFPVTAWFDNSAIPSGFIDRSWEYNGAPITIDYRKAE